VWNEASLTPRLQDMVKRLAQHVKESWETRKPIGYIRLIGHTDNTGGHEINVKFGNSRAVTVKAELQNLLREEILKRRVAILVEESPGERKWVADNTTPMGRARNRRVEVYIEPPAPPPPPPPPRPDLTAKEPQKPVIQTKPGPYPWGKLPTLPPGKTFEQWAREWLSERVGNKWLAEQIWKSIAAKDFGLAASLLHAAKVSGPEINAFLDTVRVLSQVPTAP
jgi:hypothetical protein